jgi:chromosomal replication initiator protein
MILSIRTGKNQDFRDKYREIDVLLIDDIQFLSNKEGTQEEFFHTFNTLYNSGKQIVISSDQPPKELKTLEDRLRSRFAWGFIVDITLPNFETRTAILDQKAEQMGITVSEEIKEFIAKNILSNIRDLEGALNRVFAYSKLSRKEISLELAKDALKDIIESVDKPDLSVEYIQKVVANYFNISTEDINGKKRSQNIVMPRQIAMYLCRKLLSNSMPKLGAAFGGRDHSTVIHGCNKIAELIESDSHIRDTVTEIERLIV